VHDTVAAADLSARIAVPTAAYLATKCYGSANVEVREKLTALNDFDEISLLSGVWRGREIAKKCGRP
jgi:hypothetical protein